MSGLAKVIEWQIAAAVLLAIAAGVFVPTSVRHDAIASIGMVMVAMLIGFMPLRLFLRAGPDRIVAGWIAAMIVRMFATLVGLVLLLKRYRLDLATCVWTVCGVYLVLLAVETLGMVRLMRREFEKQTDLRQAKPNGEAGDR